jgi:hypothetical protein
VPKGHCRRPFQFREALRQADGSCSQVRRGVAPVPMVCMGDPPENTRQRRMEGWILRGMDRTDPGRRFGVPAVLVGAAAARIAVYFYCAAPFEDAYITLRYARNIASGLGFVYNPCEPVLGTTTPLWTLLNALYYGVQNFALDWCQAGMYKDSPSLPYGCSTSTASEFHLRNVARWPPPFHVERSAKWVPTQSQTVHALTSSFRGHILAIQSPSSPHCQEDSWKTEWTR